MAHAEPNEPSADPGQRIALLERELRQQRQLLAVYQKALLDLHASHGWKLLTLYYRCRNHLLPPNRRRQRVARALFRIVATGCQWGARCLGFQRRKSLQEQYRIWIARNEPTRSDLERQRRTHFGYEPRISVIVPVDNTPARFLVPMLESVIHQTYANWELCLADGASTDPETRTILEDYARKDERIEVTFLPRNGGIAGTSQAALDLAAGDYVTLLDPDDTLAPFALFEVVHALNQDRDADLLYSDEDRTDETGAERQEPTFKPDWSPDVLRSHNYISHLLVLRRSLARQVGGFRAGFDGAEAHDLTLRACEQAAKIVHIPKVLYHRRIHEQSTGRDSRPKALASGVRAVNEHLRRLGIPGQATPGAVLGVYEVRYPWAGRPLVSIIIPNRDHAAVLAACLNSVARSSYQNYEVIVAENHSRLPETFDYYRDVQRDPRVRVLTQREPFNYARVNNLAAAHAAGDVLLFLNNDVEAINPDWIERMLEHALRPDVGAVGAKLYYPDDTVQHAGVILGLGGVAGHGHRGHPRRSNGLFHRLVLTQDVSAVTGACLMTRKKVFQEVGGFDEHFVLAFNDIDLCLRLREKGYLIVWTPYAELYHHESKTRGPENTPEKKARFDGEILRFLGKWAAVVQAGDPYFNPNLSLSDEMCSLRI